MIDPVAAGAAEPVIVPEALALPLVPLTAEVRVNVAPVWAMNRSVKLWLWTALEDVLRVTEPAPETTTLAFWVNPAEPPTFVPIVEATEISNRLLTPEAVLLIVNDLAEFPLYGVTPVPESPTVVPVVAKETEPEVSVLTAAPEVKVTACELATEAPKTKPDKISKRFIAKS